MRGISFPAHQAMFKPYTAEDYQRCAKFGDTLDFVVYWSADIEVDEARPGYYENMDLLRQQVNLAKSNGFKNVILSVQNSANQTGTDWWSGWSDILGADYIIMNSTGRTRYANFILALASAFPDCIIDYLFFPYHNQRDLITDTIEKYFYDVWQPLMIDAIRSGGNKQPIVCTLMLQGIYAPNYADGYSDSHWNDQIETGGFLSPNFHAQAGNCLYAVCGHEGQAGARTSQIFVFGEAWDYNVEAMRQQWLPAINSGLPVISLEFANFMHHIIEGGPVVGARPIDQSRLDLLNETLDLLCANNISYTYFRYENAVANSCPFEDDFSANAVTEILIQHAPTPTPPILPIIVGAGLGYAVGREPGAAVGALAGATLGSVSFKYRERLTRIGMLGRG